MPRHSSKNFYKAEQDYQQYHDYQDWIHKKIDHWYYEEEPYYYEWQYYDYSYSLDGHFVKVSGTRPEVKKPSIFKCWDGCDFCYEYATKDKKKLIEDSFTSKEILETLLIHIKDTKCFCYRHKETNILKWRVGKILKGPDSSIPKEYKDDFMTECVIRILDTKLWKEVRALHTLKVLNEKKALLAKYGLSYDDYEKIRIENKKLDASLQLEENPIVLPRQKFIKVKESQLKEGSF